MTTATMMQEIRERAVLATFIRREDCKGLREDHAYAEYEVGNVRGDIEGPMPVVLAVLKTVTGEVR